MQGHKYSHIYNLWGKFLPGGMICTTTDTISIPIGAMYLHARMFCTLACSLQFPWVQCQSLKPVLLKIILLPYTLAHKSSIHMGAMYLYMQEHFLHSLIQLHQVLP